ncbi:hypothetical protein HYT45_00935 [Candidatus Uhrbacteria bacterium]|nr:hypothetical protein [Candidatus Uhrbacteria bacterium]
MRLQTRFSKLNVLFGAFFVFLSLSLFSPPPAYGITQDIDIDARDEIRRERTSPSTSTTPTPAAPEAPPPTPPIVPRLQINIPTVNFSQVTQEGGFLKLPFLADYLSGLYRYLIGVVGIFAGLMLAVGGAQYLTSGGSPDRVGAAKEKIRNALIGMVIALGSYVILYTINPELVRFGALKIKQVEKVPLVFSELLTTTVVTSDPTAPEANAPTPSYTNCPISLETLAILKTDTPPPPSGAAGPQQPRNQEFRREITSILTGTTPGEKAVQIAEAAIKCGVSLGSCGKTVEIIYDIAGLGQNYPGRGIISLPTAQNNFLPSMRCLSGSYTGSYGNCVATKKSEVYAKFKREIPNWPDSYISDLKEGDHLIVFNANSNGRGGHSVLFMGWASEGIAKIAQGNWGLLVKSGTVCLKDTACPGRATPIMAVFRAEAPRQRR